MTITKTGAVTEGGHWYRRTPSGVEQINEVKGANGKLRRPSLRDARTAGDWLPGCTTIVRQAAADGLVRWQIGEAVRAAVELGGPRLRVEDGRLRPEDWTQFLRCVNQRAGEVSKEARDVGSAAHAAVHRRVTDPNGYAAHLRESAEADLAADGMSDAIFEALRELIYDWDSRVGAICEHRSVLGPDGEPMNRPEIPYESEMPDWWQALDQEQRELTYFGVLRAAEVQGVDWRSEDPLCHPAGFATAADLWTPAAGGWLFDFKGKADPDELTVKTYEQHHLQLAATREAILYTHGVDIPRSSCRIIYFSRTTQNGRYKAKVADPTPLCIERGWQMFLGLLAYYQAKTNHHPGWTE